MYAMQCGHQAEMMKICELVVRPPPPEIEAMKSYQSDSAPHVRPTSRLLWERLAHRRTIHTSDGGSTVRACEWRQFSGWQFTRTCYTVLMLMGRTSRTRRWSWRHERRRNASRTRCVFPNKPRWNPTALTGLFLNCV